MRTQLLPALCGPDHGGSDHGGSGDVGSHHDYAVHLGASHFGANPAADPTANRVASDDVPNSPTHASADVAANSGTNDKLSFHL